ncbi:phage tail tape measure protein [uncultured Bacteroides sp.]|uniref:phage tail tape measure protein n=1 Tax=uncultured Bacteroides sp. TaxID=162156 RepID=UPI002630A000|nr:phage tail tape measure protein [uncultured Bacteroides sp.]
MAKSKSEKRGIYLYIDGKEVVKDVNNIEKECRQLTQQLKTMTIGSEEYNRTMAKIQHLQGILKQHRQSLKGITTETKKATLSIGSMVDWFNRFGGVILSVIGFLTGVTLALRSIRDERNKLEESQAGLKALTGLDDESITWLTAQAKTLSTTMTKEGLRVRQSAAEILDAFMLVGSAKPELLGDKEALKAVTEEAMRLQAAAKDITLNEAVDSLTLSLNQYGEAADQAGRFANVLAAGSQAGSANIASQAKAIRNAGTAAASANVPIEQTVALIETLAYRGIKDEVAGTGLKKFFLVLQTGADEINPKIVGLDKALENLKNKNMDAGAIKKMFGEEGYNTASVILQNTEMVKDFTAAVTGTNVAYEQAAINSDTAAAKLAQARNNMKLAAIDLGEKLNPALTVSTNMLSYVIKILPGLIDWFQKWGTTIIAFIIPLATYYATLKLISLYHTTYNAILRGGIAIQTAYRIATIALNDALAGDYKAIARLVLQMRSHNIITRTVAASTLVFRAAMETLTFRFSAATKAIQAAWALLGLNPFVAIATAVAAAATGLYIYAQRTSVVARRKKELVDMNREAEKSISEEKNKLDALRKVLEDSKEPYAKRKAALEEIQSIVPEYHASLTKEGTLINNNTQALDGYVEKLLLTAKQQAANAKLQEALVQRSEWIQENGSDAMKFKNLEWEINDPVNMGKSIEELAVANGISPTAYRVWATQKKRLDANVRYYEQMMQDYTAQLLAINDKYKTVTPDPLSPVTNGGSGGTESEEERKKRVKKELEKIETEHLAKQTLLKQQYLSNDKMTQEEYLQFLSDLEIKYLNEKLKIAGLEPEKREEINNLILDKQLKLKEKIRGILSGIDRYADDEKQKQLNKLDAQERSELLTLKQGQERKLVSEEEYQQAVLDIRKKYQKEREKIQGKEDKKEQEYYNEKLRNIISDAYKSKEGNPLNFKGYFSSLYEEMQNVQEELDLDPENSALAGYLKGLENEAQQKLDDIIGLLQEASTEIGNALGNLMTGNQEGFRESLRSILQTMLSFVEKEMILAIGSVTIKSFLLNPIEALASVGKILAIKAAFATAKTAIGNFYTGGYTGPGDWDQPQGIVHSNEFVANRFAVANPNLRPIFDAIDVAQRTGNVGNLTAEDIAAVAGSGKSTRTVPAKAPTASATTTTNDPAMVAMLVECTRALRKLKERLDDPLVAETYVTGKRGVNQAQKEYQKLNNNKSRNKQ